MKILWYARIFFILPMVLFGLRFTFELGVRGVGLTAIFTLIACTIEVFASIEARQNKEQTKKDELPENTPQLEKAALPKLKEKLNDLIREYRGVIPFEALEEVIEIKTSVLILLPYLEKLSVGDYDLHNAVKIITDYLPKTLKIYSDLPREFSENSKVTEKSAEDILMEQLKIMNSQIKTIVNNANNKKLDALMIQGEFLKNKFPKE